MRSPGLRLVSRIDRGHASFEIGSYSVQVFRMANEEQTVIGQMIHQSGDYFFLRLLIEIDEHVPTKDQVKRAAQRVCVGMKIEAREFHQLTDLWRYQHQPTLVSDALQHECRKIILRYLIGLVDGIGGCGR